MLASRETLWNMAGKTLLGAMVYNLCDKGLQVDLSFLLVRISARLPPAPQMPVAKTKNLGRLPPGNLLRHRLQHHVLHLHRTLHRGLRVSIHASHGLSPSPPEKRTYHLLIGPDI